MSDGRQQNEPLDEHHDLRREKRTRQVPTPPLPQRTARAPHPHGRPPRRTNIRHNAMVNTNNHAGSRGNPENILLSFECGACLAKPWSSHWRGSYKVLANKVGLMRLRCRKCSAVYIFRVTPVNEVAKAWYDQNGGNYSEKITKRKKKQPISDDKDFIDHYEKAMTTAPKHLQNLGNFT